MLIRNRFLHARLVVFRPIVADLYLKQTLSTQNEPTKEKSLSHHLISRCATLCFDTAHEMIDVLYSNMNLNTATGPVPAWWFGVLCKSFQSSHASEHTRQTLLTLRYLVVHTAATVLLAERLRPVETHAESRDKQAQALSWNRAMEILRSYSRIGESAERCFAALEILSSKLQGGVDMEAETAKSPRRDAHMQDDFTTEPNSRGNANLHGNGMEGDAAWSFNLGTTDFDALDFDIDDLLWLNTSGVDVLL